ncbi:unnamed protein product [Linum tenue]|uniref:Cyclin n=1 Tax=Linum tenue TaxID=586396 RepID=A0AAV0MTQ0_9ROSI|nr:unnamed protein product [Linum tenue]
MAALDLEIGSSSSSSSSSMPPKVIRFLSCLLQRVADSNDVMMTQLCGGGGSMSIFHGLSRPNISIHSYLERIFKYANCSPSCFVVAYVYLDRFAQKQPSIPISSLNVHRLLITSVLVSAKFMDDMILQQCVLRESWRDQQRRDESAGSGFPVRDRIRIECDTNHVPHLLLPPPSSDGDSPIPSFPFTACGSDG